MGFKSWTRGQQKGFRVYTPSINELSKVLNVPSSNTFWTSLAEFIEKIKRVRGKKHVKPYTRNLNIMDFDMKKSIDVSLTIAQHNSSTQGYITVSSGNWLYSIVEKNLGKDFLVEYIVGDDTDILILPKRFENFLIEKQRLNEVKRIENKVSKIFKTVPRNLDKIRLYFELEEVKYLKRQGLKPIHRYPYIESSYRKIRKRSIICDIDVFDKSGKFLKFVEVKAVYGRFTQKFVLTKSELESREKCRKNGWKYDIVVYYHIGKHVVQRKLISETDDLITEPFQYLCSQRI